MQILLIAGLGLGAGVLSGLFGIGGGVIVVPGLIYMAGLDVPSALGTSLAALLLPVGLLGAWAYWNAGDVNLHAAAVVATGLFLGAWGGARFALSLPTPVLQRAFAVFLGAIAVRMWFGA